MRTFAALMQDDAGFIISAELVLIATVAVLALVVGLSEMAHAINAELNDVAEAFGSLNQSFCVSGFKAFKPGCFAVNHVSGSAFVDRTDSCDRNECDIACCDPLPEAPKGGGHHGGYGY